MNILFLSAWYPYPANNGSRLRIYNLLKGLASAQHQITLISFVDQPEVDLSGLSEICKEVITVPWESNLLSTRQKRFAFLSKTPQSFLDTFSEKMANAIRMVFQHSEIDLVIASQIKAGAYGKYLQGTPAIFEELELGVMYDQFAAADSFKQKCRYALTWYKHKMFVESVFNHYQICTVVSIEEKKLFEQKLNLPQIASHVIPNGVDVSSYTPFRTQKKNKNTLIYTGSFGFFANYDAMVWFVGKVLPIVQSKVADVKLVITGDHKNLPLPENDSVELTGFVDDIRPLVAEASISLAPLLQGGGTRLKILEAMALGTPVVATSKGAQGLDATPGLHFLQADSAEEFANKVIQVIKNDELAHQLTQKAFELVTSKYDWNVILPEFLEIVKCLKN